MNGKTNSHGVPVGLNGRVICRRCQAEIWELSSETPFQYAYHPKCEPERIEKTKKRIEELKAKQKEAL